MEISNQFFAPPEALREGEDKQIWHGEGNFHPSFDVLGADYRSRACKTNNLQ